MCLCAKNPSVDKTSQTYSAKVDVFVNGNQICNGQTFKFKKKTASAQRLYFLRFAMFGKDKTENGAAVYPEFTVYLDDVDIKRYDEYPEIPLPENEPELDITFEGASARANLKNAVMVLAGYGADGALLSAEIAENDGNASLELKGEYTSAKVFSFNSFESLTPLQCSVKKECRLLRAGATASPRGREAVISGTAEQSRIPVCSKR
ncbi:MAG: hypothetical protein L6V93_14850 [Clostridiales bacterium]|nr:MAG: hypothetical protein L6V93_14850 [Clostridiales bacterium]